MMQLKQNIFVSKYVQGLRLRQTIIGNWDKNVMKIRRFKVFFQQKRI